MQGYTENLLEIIGLRVPYSTGGHPIWNRACSGRIAHFSILSRTRMTIETMNVDLSTLKMVKNSVIGNPSAKLARAQDQDFVQK